MAILSPGQTLSVTVRCMGCGNTRVVEREITKVRRDVTALAIKMARESGPCSECNFTPSGYRLDDGVVDGYGPPEEVS